MIKRHMSPTVSILVGLCLTFAVSTSHAGKVEEVQAVVKSSCSKDIAGDEALRLVKNLFLSCAPGSDVDVDGCKVKCLKENSGAVVGK